MIIAGFGSAGHYRLGEHRRSERALHLDLLCRSCIEQLVPPSVDEHR